MSPIPSSVWLKQWEIPHPSDGRMALHLNTATVTFSRIGIQGSLVPIPLRCAELLCTLLAAGATQIMLGLVGPCVNHSVSLLVNISINMIDFK